MSNGFRTPLRIEVLGDQRYRLLELLVYENNWIRITAYPPFESDSASIPRPLWSKIGSPLTGNYPRAAFLHDAIYRSHILPKDKADELFREMMLADGVEHVLAETIYLGVKYGGHDAYDSASELSKHRDLIRVDIL